MDKLLNLEYNDYKQHIITPISPYLICKHHFATEIYSYNNKYIEVDINILCSNSPNDLYKNKNYNEINEGDIVMVQVDLFEFFINNILPKINTRIILITSQFHLPQLYKSHITDNCLNNDKIILWISQNPIYENHHKYMAFPYGIYQNNVNLYMNFVKKNKESILNYKTKVQNVYNSNIRIHPHLPANHIRRNPIFESVNKSIDNYEYLNNILKSKFVISTSGDRDDCYRHYECIGLNSIPISNITYKEIFGKNMIYFDVDNIIKFINKEINIDYYNVNRDVLTLEYWKNEIEKRCDVN
jgi:hypothetical protein